MSESTWGVGKWVWEARLTVRKTPLHYPWRTAGVYAVFSSMNAALKGLMSLKIFTYFCPKIHDIMMYNYGGEEMKEIQGRLKNKNKLRGPLGRVEKKWRPICLADCNVALLSSAAPSCAGRQSGALLLWVTLHGDTCATTALVLLGAAAGQVACLMFGAALSAQCHQPYYLCGLCQHPPQPYMVQGCLSRWQRMILSAAWESLLPCCN